MPEHADRQSAPPSRRGRFSHLMALCDPASVLRFVRRQRTRWVICWLIALASGVVVVEQAWTCFDQPERADGNWGHCSIDFGGQWTLGRMIVEGHSRHLYHRNYLRMAVEGGYPAGVEGPKADRSDAENLLIWMMGRDDSEAPAVMASFLIPLAANDGYSETVLLATGRDFWTEERIEHVVAPQIGGSMYPPIHALLFAPLSTMRPPIAYRVWQALILALLFFDGWLVHQLTEGRVWWPVAAVFLMLFPGFAGAINLGQNAMLSLTVLLLGWWQLQRGRPALAGVFWGLLAYKPVWAASFFLVPLLSRRWRMAASMAITGLVQIALTLPVVGWRTWLDWLQVGRIGANEYAIDENWIILSRDLLGIPRRWLLTFEGGLANNPEEQLLPTVLGWSLWAAVFVFTLLVVWRRRRRMDALVGPPAAFLLIGVLFSCYHFMYYDFVLAALPVCLLFTEPRRYLQAVFCHRPRWLARWRGESAEPKDALPPAEMQRYYQPGLDDLVPPPMPLLPGGQRPRWVLAPVPPLLLVLMLTLPGIGFLCDPTYHFPPGETFALLLLWAWCGYRVLTDAETTDEIATSPARVVLDGPVDAAQLPQLGADVGRAHERLADQHRADASRL